ncbi:alginate O-acetyltransferase complex protein AlgF [Rhizobium tibeticum]|uniref:alginate O-acetyltransferase AlgF n=1 Tax=Rhizobium tibeticum TaxID=501024 RepID=UPI002780EB55|nr:alginate O-acetyltransferase AlgF [Rhizobium tibeticum]MDP9811534.1 alginate O-acetyltransferase complex protein AlgF [Rhizobium tibeticum]
MIISRTCAALCVAMLALVTPITGLAQDAGLYGKPVDPNGSFIRIVDINASSAVIAGAQVANFTEGVSPYVTVKPGDVDMSIGSESTKVTADPGKYYTYAKLSDGQGKLYVDGVKDDPSKAQVYLYNLTDLQTVDLVVPVANATALKAVASGTSQSVSLRAPLSLVFVIQQDGKTIAETEKINLKRRAGFSIVLSGSKGDYHVVAAENHLSQ